MFEISRRCCLLAAACGGLLSGSALGQSISYPWYGFGHSPQHGANASVAAQPLNRILWQTKVDLSVGPMEHYGSPLITRSNTVIVPVKTSSTGSFEVKAFVATNGAQKWLQTTDYRLPPHVWIPSYSPALTPKNRLYFPGGGGTVYYCDNPDASNAVVTGQIAFYGLANYLANTNAYLSNVFIHTPITSDRYGNIFFGFQVTGSTPLSLQSGLARIAFDGTATWVAASATVTNLSVNKVVMNCSPALSNDHKTLYIAVNSASYVTFNQATAYGCLVALDSRTLAPLGDVRLYDYANPANNALVLDDASASPTIGPDGDVYYGVLEDPQTSNHDRGWLLHFDGTLAHAKLPGAYGWDSTASIVPSAAVPSYTNGSPYLLLTKYNNATDAGGDGVDRVAILDPQNSMTDPITGKTVMNIALAAIGPTPDKDWCLNTTAIDPITKSVMANSEDGKLYRWDLTSNTLSQTNMLTSTYGFEAYTPTVVGVDGIVYAMNNGTLYAVGR
jgi:hypothetical protein